LKLLPIDYEDPGDPAAVRAWMDVFWDRCLAASFPEDPKKRGTHENNYRQPREGLSFQKLLLGVLKTRIQLS